MSPNELQKGSCSQKGVPLNSFWPSTQNYSKLLTKEFIFMKTWTSLRVFLKQNVIKLPSDQLKISRNKKLHRMFGERIRPVCCFISSLHCSLKIQIFNDKWKKGLNDVIKYMRSKIKMYILILIFKIDNWTFHASPLARYN